MIQACCPWSRQNVLGLTSLVPLEDISKIRACYFATKIDPKVFLDPTPATDDPSNANAMKPIDEHKGFHWKPKSILENYLKDKKDSIAQKKLFDHMNNYVSISHGAIKWLFR